MKGLYTLFFAGFTGFFSVSLAQTGCTIPQPPVLTFVTVQPGSGAIHLEWTSSPSTGVVGYIVHKFRNEIGTPVDTLWDPAAMSLTYNEVESKYYTLSYAVSALRLPDCESILSNSISTIFNVTGIDTCKREISVKWNAYPDFPRKVLRYEVLAFIGQEPAPVVYSTDPTITSFILRGFRIGTKYCLTVNAVLEGGSISGSLTNCLFTGMTVPPDWINADFATVDDQGKIQLSFTIDPLSEIKKYILERKEGYSGQFEVVAQLLPTAGNLTYTDGTADNKKINFYRLSAINFCNSPVMVSNISSTIVTTVAVSGNDLRLSWNPYRKWNGNTAAYRVLVNKGEGYGETALVQPEDTVYSFSYNEIMQQATSGNICFKVAAFESGNPYGNNGESISAETCLQITEVITVPDLFTPDGDLVNDLFKPVISFMPRDYHLIISNRKGKVVFETRNSEEPWDGTESGNSLPGDVYLWFLKTTGPSGKKFSRTGTVTIFRNR